LARYVLGDMMNGKIRGKIVLWIDKILIKLGLVGKEKWR